MPSNKPIPKELNLLIAVQPLLEALSEPARDRLIDSSTIMTFAPNERLIREDEENKLLYFLLKGEASVMMNGTPAGFTEAGDVIGEISISGISPPIATVVADTPVEAVGFPAAAINEAIEAHPEFGRRLKEAAFRRISG